MRSLPFRSSYNFTVSLNLGHVEDECSFYLYYVAEVNPVISVQS